MTCGSPSHPRPARPAPEARSPPTTEGQPMIDTTVGTQATTFAEITLDDGVRDALAARLCPLPSPVTDIDRSLAVLHAAFAALPVGQLQQILDFGRHVDTPGVTLVRNLPVDPSLPPTPVDGLPSGQKQTFVAEGVLL